MTQTAENEVIEVLDIVEENYPQMYKTDGLGQFYEKAKAESEGEVPDLTTKKGRDRIASLAAKVSKSKKAVENPGREYNKIQKEIPKQIDAELKKFCTDMDALRDKIRKPLTDWENIEKKRIEDIEGYIEYLSGFKVVLNPDTGELMTAEELKVKQAEVKAIEIKESDFAEFTEKASEVQCDILDFFDTAIAQRVQFEIDQAELTRLKDESDERDRKDRDERIAREATEKANTESAQKIKDAEIEKQVAIKNAEREKQEAIDNAKKQADDAVEAERQRKSAEEEQQRQETEEKLRQANIAAANETHQREINNLTLNELCKCGGITNTQAEKIVKGLVRKQFAHITINY